MPLSPHTQKIIAEVEELSGRKVRVQEDPSLPTLATVVTARGSAPFHLVRYRDGGSATNYLIVYQLKFLARMFSCPEGARWEMIADPEEKAEGSEGLGLSSLPPQLASSMFDSLITQLRTYPVGMRIDGQILREIPDLRAEQESSVLSQLAENERALAPEIRQKFPERLVDANSAMNAAYAKFWSGHLGEPRYSIPYTALGYSGIADRLSAALDATPDKPEGDRPLIESWAQILNLSEYFHFQTHRFDAR